MNCPSPVGQPPSPAPPLSPSGHSASLVSTPQGTAGPCHPSAASAGTRTAQDLRQQPGKCTAAGGPGAPGGCPTPNPPLFSQGLHFQRSPWDPAPSPRPHAPRKIGSAGACLFAVAAAPACDYSCSTAGCCRPLCTSARLPRGAGTPHATPGWAGVPPLLLSIPGYGNQGTPVFAACGQGSVAGHGWLSLGCPHKDGVANACRWPAARTGQV